VEEEVVETQTYAFYSKQDTVSTVTICDHTLTSTQWIRTINRDTITRAQILQHRVYAELAPNDGRLFENGIEQQTIACKRIAVLTCGPEQMVDDLRALCGSDLGARFDFHSERFAF
jgi:hypothetical protein